MLSILPGQFDQRADSAVQCVQFLNADEKPVIRTATIYVIEGIRYRGRICGDQDISVSTRWIPEKPVMEKPETLVTVFEDPEDVIDI